jgi:hypothetical protein
MQTETGKLAHEGPFGHSQAISGEAFQAKGTVYAKTGGPCVFAETTYTFVCMSPRLRLRSGELTRCQWLIPIILATQEAEIRRILVPSQHRQIVPETL